MPRHLNPHLPCLAAVILIAAACASAHAQTIRMQPAAMITGATVQLGDIATFQNADPATADALARIVLLPNFHGEARVQAHDVLFAVIALRPELAPRLQVQGAAECALTAANTPATSPVLPAATIDPAIPAQPTAQANRSVAAETSRVAPAAVSPPGADPTGTSESQPGVTLSQLLTSQVAEALAAVPQDVRVSFETVSPWLDRPTAAGQRWSYRPLARTFLGTVQWEAQLQQGHQTLQRLIIQAKVLKRVSNLISTAIIKRGDVITADLFRVEDRWVDRAVPDQFTDPAAVIGQEAQRPVAVGGVLDQRDFKPTELVGRGDLVDAYVVSGGLKVKMQARALSGGKLRDRISIRNEATGERFEGILIGKRLVLIGPAVDAATEQKLREER